MASSPAQDPSWHDFDTLRHSVKNYTVDRLKQIIHGLSEECGAMISKTGKKQDLIDRITRTLDNYRHTQQIDCWNRAKGVLYQVRSSGIYSPGTGGTLASSLSTTPAQNNSVSATTPIPNFTHSSNGAGPSNIGRYDPMGSLRRPTIPPLSAALPAKPGSTTTIKFKSSPFFVIDQSVSPVVECPESTGAVDRKSQTLLFGLTQEQLIKLSQSTPKYQLRLFCTSSTFYTAPPGFRSNALPCPIEFPATCEVRVNNVQLTANLKGVKKKPGTAPPADLGRSVRSVVNHQNRVEMVYVNSQQPVVPKKYYLVVFLVEVTEVDQLVEKLRKGKYRSMDEIKSRMVKTANEDDEIVAGNQTMSLKCPLSYTRIKTPCRSEKCVHSQCFDATSWYSVMEQTTTWLCPVCEKLLNPEDLIVDGYFDSILRSTPDSVEEVVVEPDGEWYTTDKKYYSPGCRTAHPNSPRAKSQTSSLPPSSRTGTSSTGPSQEPSSISSKDKISRLNSEVVVLDSDDEDEGRIKRELSPSYGRQTNGNASALVSSTNKSTVTCRQPSKQAAVIDLTLDSDTDDPPPVPKTMKRKAEDALLEPVELSPKRTRPDVIPLANSLRTANSNGTGYAKASSSSSSPTAYYSTHAASISPTQGGGHAPQSSSVAHRTLPQPVPYSNSRFPYPSYSPPRVPGSRSGSAYDPPRSTDPRQHSYPPPPPNYNSNPYLGPRVNGSGTAGWP